MFVSCRIATAWWAARGRPAARDGPRGRPDQRDVGAPGCGTTSAASRRRRLRGPRVAGLRGGARCRHAAVHAADADARVLRLDLGDQEPEHLHPVVAEAEFLAVDPDDRRPCGGSSTRSTVVRTTRTPSPGSGIAPQDEPRHRRRRAPEWLEAALAVVMMGVAVALVAWPRSVGSQPAESQAQCLARGSRRRRPPPWPVALRASGRRALTAALTAAHSTGAVPGSRSRPPTVRGAITCRDPAPFVEIAAGPRTYPARRTCTRRTAGGGSAGRRAPPGATWATARTSRSEGEVAGASTRTKTRALPPADCCVPGSWTRERRRPAGSSAPRAAGRRPQ